MKSGTVPGAESRKPGPGKTGAEPGRDCWQSLAKSLPIRLLTPQLYRVTSSRGRSRQTQFQHESRRHPSAYLRCII